MNIYATVLNKENKPIAGVVATIADPVLKTTVNFVTDANGQFWFSIPDAYIWEYGVSSVTVTLQAPGYAVNIITQRVNLVEQNKNVTYIMEGGQKFPKWVVLLVVSALLLYRKQTKKVGALSDQDVKNLMLLTGGVIGFALLKQLLEFLGVWQSKEEKQLDEISTNPNSFWNPNFWQTKPSYVNWTAPLTQTQATQISQELYSSINWYGDDEDKIKGIFRTFRAQSSVSYVAYIFQSLYQKDLLSFLRGGTPPFEGLSDTDVFEINNFISQLPKY